MGAYMDGAASQGSYMEEQMIMGGTMDTSLRHNNSGQIWAGHGYWTLPAAQAAYAAHTAHANYAAHAAHAANAVHEAYVVRGSQPMGSQQSPLEQLAGGGWEQQEQLAVGGWQLEVVGEQLNRHYGEFNMQWVLVDAPMAQRRASFQQQQQQQHMYGAEGHIAYQQQQQHTLGTMGLSTPAAQVCVCFTRCGAIDMLGRSVGLCEHALFVGLS